MYTLFVASYNQSYDVVVLFGTPGGRPCFVLLAEEFEAKRAMRYGKGRPGAAKGKGSESVRQPQLQPQLDCPGEHGLVRFEAKR